VHVDPGGARAAVCRQGFRGPVPAAWSTRLPTASVGGARISAAVRGGPVGPPSSRCRARAHRLEVPGIEQELYALLTVYQALVRTAGDLTLVHAELPSHRISFTVLLRAAADTIVAGEGKPIAATATFVGTIGRAALANLHPPRPRHRLKARIRKRHSKYPFTRVVSRVMV